MVRSATRIPPVPSTICAARRRHQVSPRPARSPSPGASEGSVLGCSEPTFSINSKRTPTGQEKQSHPPFFNLSQRTCCQLLPSIPTGFVNTNGDPTNHLQDIMAETGTSPLPSLPKEASALEASFRHSITEWKSDLWSLKRSMSKARAKGAGAPEYPGLPVLAEQTARREPEWPRT